MKALLVKNLPQTNTQPYRLKVSAEGQKPKIYSASQFDVNADDTVGLKAARKYANELGWYAGRDFVIGQLPNLSYAVIPV